MASSSRGVIVCVGQRMLASFSSFLFQLRRLWNSSLPVAAVHCAEHSVAAQRSITDMYRLVSFVDLCAPSRNRPFRGVYGMERNYSMGRLRGFFCKPAALLASPFVENMVVDLDVIWLQRPDALFDSPRFAQTGTLFFRDRGSMFEKVAGPYLATSTTQMYYGAFEAYLKRKVTAEMATKQHKRNNGSIFWWPLAGVLSLKNGMAMTHFQDSSVLLFEKRKQHETLRYIRRLLPTFAIGYGDKEIYWVAASLAGVEFAFEPYFTGSFGDCGVLMHFDPRDATPSTGRPDPYYINGEWFVEGIDYVGAYLDAVGSVTNAVRVSITYNFEGEVHKLLNKGPSRLAARGCTCPTMTCRAVPLPILKQVLLAQWFSYVAERRDNGVNVSCVPVLKPFLQPLQEAMHATIEATRNTKNNNDEGRNRSFCAHIGCALFDTRSGGSSSSSSSSGSKSSSSPPAADHSAGGASTVCIHLVQ